MLIKVVYERKLNNVKKIRFKKQACLFNLNKLQLIRLFHDNKRIYRWAYTGVVKGVIEKSRLIPEWTYRRLSLYTGLKIFIISRKKHGKNSF